jgi:hypothetical protein
VTIVPNTDGLTGGIALWRDKSETSSPLRKGSKTAKRKNARPRTGLRSTGAPGRARLAGARRGDPPQDPGR